MGLSLTPNQPTLKVVQQAYPSHLGPPVKLLISPLHPWTRPKSTSSTPSFSSGRTKSTLAPSSEGWPSIF
ncbi:hypothetical protein RSOL_494510 [Rhizoctonia solani AG-3 Rhs1AP]|uniref:Uncharacterized protein n=1 Tax=Rhizoctonia solani AG-3 Rhs1AP TaxID=1086054 RepID=X8JP31_9AGAM|nr:hypothetical protein RSOL_494510 [Rhizoctonia solani AG-3 Rhs1AP]